jgi:signal transduction histidine kinase
MQESIFITLNVLLLALLLGLHTSLTAFWGTPSHTLIIALCGGLLLGATQLVWVHRLPRSLTARQLHVITWLSIGINLLLAALLSELTDHEDSPYYVLMIVPVLQAAFRFPVLPLAGVILSADCLNFFWVWRFFHKHPPADSSEFLEAGINSLLFAMVGFLVWILVNHLRQKEFHLASNLLELERTREKLLQEETLAAVGRLSSAIAHEIRNPVAMISTSLATAAQPGLPESERNEMRTIATREASRLEKLTDDLLSYARPRKAHRALMPLSDTLYYVASVCRAHAGQKQVSIEVDTAASLLAEVDAAQVQQALLNLVMNAVDASPSGHIVRLRAQSLAETEVRIDVENEGTPIAGNDLARIFEPFFTTKNKGTGLGLAIARNIARAQGGDLTLAENRPEKIRFSMTLPAAIGAGTRKLQAHG